MDSLSRKKEHFPAICLVFVGLFFFFVIPITGFTDPGGPVEYSARQVADDCETNSEPVYQFDNLSPRGQAFFTTTVQSPDERVTIERDVPQEFSVSPGDMGPEDPDGDDGTQYICKDGALYRLSLVGPGPLGGAVKGLIVRFSRIAGGIALTIAGVASLMKPRTTVPSVLLAISSIFLISPLFWLIGQLRWAIWIETHPESKFILLLVLGIAGAIYISDYELLKRFGS